MFEMVVHDQLGKNRHRNDHITTRKETTSNL